ncbi:MAG: protein translocase subunit SecD [Calditrichaeota bacterium]|nr:protein translocase subunit SecD [Calditrichota bacterium]
MSNRVIWKLILIFFIVAFFGYYVIPTLQFNSMSRQERNQLEIDNPEQYESLAKKSIKLGLDLQGGMNVVMEVDLKKLLVELANERRQSDPLLVQAVDEAVTEFTADGGDVVDLLDKHLSAAGGKMTTYYADRERRTHEDVMEYLKTQREESVDRALEVLRNRVDEFGVSEPVIQKQGENRIIIELAGITDRQQALKIIGETAKLEFNLLRDVAEAQKVAAAINDYLLGKAGSDSTAVSEDTGAESAAGDTAITSDDLFGNQNEAAADTGSATAEDLVTDNQEPFFIISANGILVNTKNEARLEKMLSDPEVLNVIDREVGKNVAKLLIQAKSTLSPNASGDQYLEVYLVNARPELTGSTIVDARPSSASLQDAQNLGRYEASITFNEEGTRLFSTVTGANVGKRMAIILDDRVRSAPNIIDKIANGRARITGLESFDEAKVLTSVLRAGALPAPLEIIEQRSVGASLGDDSISMGMKSAGIGLLLVVLFMIFYYKLSGLVADLALVLNIVILIGFMASLHATLTLPGIAGIILTIGMAVDANVLIFERVREEMDRGKSIISAIDTGYSRAFITILDANVTTFIAGVVLYQFGSGPIRGFATTLMIGIAASMFTAIFVTRTIFEFLLSRKMIKTLSI